MKCKKLTDEEKKRKKPQSCASVVNVKTEHGRTNYLTLIDTWPTATLANKAMVSG